VSEITGCSDPISWFAGRLSTTVSNTALRKKGWGSLGRIGDCDHLRM